MFQSTKLFEQAIGLQPPWSIKSVKFDVEGKRLDIYVDFEKGSKFYHEEKDKDGNIVLSGEFGVHDTTQKKWRHLNFFEHECYLHCRTPRLDLGNGKVKIYNPPFSGLSNGFTLLFEALSLQLCKSMSVAEAGRLVNESEHKLWSMIDRYVTAGRLEENYETVKSVGVDETSKAKGHDYITAFVDQVAHKVIYVTEGKDSSTVEKFVEDLEEHGGKAENIEWISSDLSPAFIKGIRENLPKAEIVFDRFHVMKIVNEAVDNVRRGEVKDFPILKKARYVVLKNEENLTKNQKEKLEEIKLSKQNLKTMKARQIREALQLIYESQSKGEFVLLLKKWYYWATHSRISEIIKVAKTLKRHWQGIVNWYDSKISNGILEGINSVIQLAKARARGYRTFRNFANIIYLMKGDLDFTIVNSSYPLFST